MRTGQDRVSPTPRVPRGSAVNSSPFLDLDRRVTEKEPHTFVSSPLDSSSLVPVAPQNLTLDRGCWSPDGEITLEEADQAHVLVTRTRVWQPMRETDPMVLALLEVQVEDHVDAIKEATGILTPLVLSLFFGI